MILFCQLRPLKSQWFLSTTRTTSEDRHQFQAYQKQPQATFITTKIRLQISLRCCEHLPQWLTLTSKRAHRILSSRKMATSSGFDATITTTCVMCSTHQRAKLSWETIQSYNKRRGRGSRMSRGAPCRHKCRCTRYTQLERHQCGRVAPATRALAKCNLQ